MRKSKFSRIGFSLLTIMLTANISSAQNLIAVQNGNSATLYVSLDSAVTLSQAGDTINIPGGIFNLNNKYIDKKLTIVGVGHNIDSSQASGITYITSSIYFVDGSSGSSITGIYLTGAVFLTYGQSSFPSPPGIDNISISRCNIQSLNGNYDGTGWGGCCACVSNSQADNFLVTENVIRGGIGGIDGNMNVFSNNIIEGSLVSLGQNFFKNNIFLIQGSCPYFCNSPTGRTQNATFENNIFLTPTTTFGAYNICGGGAYSSNSIFSNNVFAEALSFPYCSNCLDYNNYVGVNPASIFINQSGNTFNYNQNYHLQNSSLFSGTDGTQVGIYGGTFAWKEGSIPFNPHVQSKNISGTTNTNGNLPVNIKVAAQDH